MLKSNRTSKLDFSKNKLKKNSFFIFNTDLLKFSKEIYFLLVENFPNTYFVGGMVRNMLLKRKVTDVDIATSAKPNQVVEILKNNNIKYSDNYIQFGTVTALYKNFKIEITTLRKDLKGDSRYNRVLFINSPKIDSKRRDFTINSLYLSLNPVNILDFHKGLIDLQKYEIKFIGNPEKRVIQDPLRIIRALRFAIDLNLKINFKTKQIIMNNLYLLNSLSKNKIEKEIEKVLSKKNKYILRQALISKKFLDKHFK